MNPFNQFMDILSETEEELGKKLKDFTVEDFYELETEMDEELFRDSKVINQLKACGAIVEIKKDGKGTLIKLKDGTQGVFGA